MIIPYSCFEMQIDKPSSMKSKVIQLQKELIKLPQYEPVTRHYFHGGMYCRVVKIDQGVTVVGKVHKKEHFFIVMSGTLVTTIDDRVETLEGPCIISSNSGAKRAMFSKTDVEFMTLHKTDALTIEDAENELVEYDPESPYGPGNILKNKVIEVAL